MLLTNKIESFRLEDGRCFLPRRLHAAPPPSTFFRVVFPEGGARWCSVLDLHPGPRLPEVPLVACRPVPHLRKGSIILALGVDLLLSPCLLLRGEPPLSFLAVKKQSEKWTVRSGPLPQPPVLSSDRRWSPPRHVSFPPGSRITTWRSDSGGARRGPLRRGSPSLSRPDSDDNEVSDGAGIRKTDTFIKNAFSAT
ncbi:hypothetical protein EYF80_050061 [Liparis tanakae]|uniref:Uncharacterized protein n=1 Tax=Liparis tanakae TaxID=230148 RepID=A0A4Z2FF23_9TELE|nr:hypothetical protein EYF80_050061 [Liparis tanakae]